MARQTKTKPVFRPGSAASSPHSSFRRVRPASSHPSFRRGFVYTLCIFLLMAVVLELLAAWAQHTDRRALDLAAPSDGEMLLLRQNELSAMASQALGVNASLSRNGTALILNISDGGFPLTDNSNGGAYVTRLQNWLQTNWTTATHTSISFNVTVPNDTGMILNLSPANISYVQDNLYTNANDSANLTMPSNATPVNVVVDIACSYPSATSAIAYTDWSAVGSDMSGTIHYHDNFTSTTHSHTQPMDKANAAAFSARYTDAAGAWLQTIHIDWNPSYTLSIWDEANAAYTPPYYPANISCNWNISLVSNYTNSTAETLYIPVNVSLRYANASYSGWLTVARD